MSENVYMNISMLNVDRNLAQGIREMIEDRTLLQSITYYISDPITSTESDGDTGVVLNRVVDRHAALMMETIQQKSPSHLEMIGMLSVFLNEARNL